MQIDLPLISRLEQLAHLKLSDDERVQMLADLNRILQMVEKLKELDTTGVEPLTHLSETTITLRVDEIDQSTLTTEFQENAPSHDGKFFLVPKVIG